MASGTKTAGDKGEDVATAHLARLGWRIVARNLLFRVGEIDILAEDGEHLVFVEVRSRHNGWARDAAHTVTLPKQRRLTRAANLALRHYVGPCPYARFDVVAIDLARGAVTEHIRGAFDACEF